MYYKCKNQSTKGAYGPAWTGMAELTKQTAVMAELLLYGRGSRMDTIIGKYQSGLYLCIPDIDVGCPLSSMSDIFWNWERMAGQMNAVDAATVACGLKAAAAHWGIFSNRT